MRIISGNAKGKKIFIPLDKKTRPLKDMVRESIFNIIAHSNLANIEFQKSFVLDLFSGVGSFGLEMISRGASKVIFYEDYQPALEMLKKNIDILSFNSQAEVYKKDIYIENEFNNLNYKFDLVFIDPPFKDNKLIEVLNKLSESTILKSNTLIILHRHRKTNDTFQKNFKILREEIYGMSKIIFGCFTF